MQPYNSNFGEKKVITIFVEIIFWFWTLNWQNKRLKLKFLYAVLEEWIFENFLGPSYDDVFSRWLIFMIEQRNQN